MSNQTKQRDYLFDNYKAFLILLVVIGHFIEPAYNNNTLLYTLKCGFGVTQNNWTNTLPK